MNISHGMCDEVLEGFVTMLVAGCDDACDRVSVTWFLWRGRCDRVLWRGLWRGLYWGQCDGVSVTWSVWLDFCVWGCVTRPLTEMTRYVWRSLRDGACVTVSRWQKPCDSNHETVSLLQCLCDNAFATVLAFETSFRLKSYLRLSEWHCHTDTLTEKLSHGYCHPDTVTWLLSPWHCHMVTVTLTLSHIHCHKNYN